MKRLTTIAVVICSAFFTLGATSSAAVKHPFTLRFAHNTIQRTVRQAFKSYGLASLTPHIGHCFWSTPIVATCVLHGPSLISGGERTYLLHLEIGDYS